MVAGLAIVVLMAGLHIASRAPTQVLSNHVCPLTSERPSMILDHLQSMTIDHIASRPNWDMAIVAYFVRTFPFAFRRLRPPTRIMSGRTTIIL